MKWALDQDSISVTEVKNAVHGSVSITEGNIVFVPEQDFVGQAGFTYVANDGSVDNEASVTVTVYESLDSDQVIITPAVTLTPTRPKLFWEIFPLIHKLLSLILLIMPLLIQEI